MPYVKRGTIEEWNKTITSLKKAHRLAGTHCHKHPNGSPNCAGCGATKYIKVSIGEALRLLKSHPLTDLTLLKNER